MKAMLMITGTDRSTVAAARSLILDILRSKVPESVMLKALDAAVTICGAPHVSISNCRFDGGSSK